MRPFTRFTFTSRYVGHGCLALAALVTALLLISVYGHFTGDSAAANAVTASGNPAQGAAPAADRAKAYRDAQLDRINQRNVFAPIPQPARLVGVLGRQAIFHDNRVLGIGQTIDGATIVSIGADSITVERDGEEQILRVFSGQAPIRPQASASAPAAPAAAPAPPGSIAPPGGPPTLRPEDIERFREMPEAARQQMLQQMPPEIVEQLRGALD